MIAERHQNSGAYKLNGPAILAEEDYIASQERLFHLDGIQLAPRSGYFPIYRALHARAVHFDYLGHKDRQIIRDICCGLSIAQVSKLHGKTINHVSNMVRSRAGRVVLKEIMGELDQEARDVRRKVDEMTPVAADFISRVIDGREVVPPELRYRAAKDQMDRAGFGAINKNLSATIPPERMKSIRERAEQLRNSRNVELVSEGNTRPVHIGLREPDLEVALGKPSSETTAQPSSQSSEKWEDIGQSPIAAPALQPSSRSETTEASYAIGDGEDGEATTAGDGRGGEGNE